MKNTVKNMSQFKTKVVSRRVLNQLNLWEKTAKLSRLTPDKPSHTIVHQRKLKSLKRNKSFKSESWILQSTLILSISIRESWLILIN